MIKINKLNMQLSVDKVNNKALLEKRPAINQHMPKARKTFDRHNVRIW